MYLLKIHYVYVYVAWVDIRFDTMKLKTVLLYLFLFNFLASKIISESLHGFQMLIPSPDEFKISMVSVRVCSVHFCLYIHLLPY